MVSYGNANTCIDLNNLSHGSYTREIQLGGTESVQ